MGDLVKMHNTLSKAILYDTKEKEKILAKYKKLGGVLINKQKTNLYEYNSMGEINIGLSFNIKFSAPWVEYFGNLDSASIIEIEVKD